MKPIILFVHDKSSEEQLRLIVTEYKGQVRLDLREYFRDHESFLPTKRGIVLNDTEVIKRLTAALRDGLRLLKDRR